MIRLEANAGVRTLFAEVFIEEGERAIAVVLYEHERPIAPLRIDEREISDAVASCVDWMVEYDLSEDSGDALMTLVLDEFQTLEQIRTSGPDVAHDWLGSPASRRIPQL